VPDWLADYMYGRARPWPASSRQQAATFTALQTVPETSEASQSIWTARAAD
jgi:hypothetical protein